MKILKKKVVVILLAVVVFLTGICTIGGTLTKKANALSPEYNGGPYTIYYFTDYYPTVSNTELADEFPEYHVLYDYQVLTESDFNKMVYSGYFRGFPYDTCVVIIDIKTFMPDPNTLSDLFSNLQIDQGCITAFVSIYDEGEYKDTSFLEYVNIFINDAELLPLRNFIYNSFTDLMIKNDTVDSTTYLIDSNLIHVYLYYGADMETLCSSSPFLRLFLEQLFDFSGNSWPGSYEKAADILREEFNIKLLVHTNGSVLVDILTWKTYNYLNIYWLMAEAPKTDFACAFGFWALTYDFYQDLYNIQYNEGYSIPIYICTIDPVNYSPLGLKIITDTDLGEVYGDEWEDKAASNLLDGLHKWID